MYAISSAGVAFAVTRACSSGELEKCGCDRTVHGVSPQGKCGRWGGAGGGGRGAAPPSLTTATVHPLHRLPVVGMLGQHRLWRGLLPVLRGRAGEKQGGLIQPRPHEPPQQRGWQEGRVALLLPLPPPGRGRGRAGQGAWNTLPPLRHSGTFAQAPTSTCVGRRGTGRRVGEQTGEQVSQKRVRHTHTHP